MYETSEIPPSHSSAGKQSHPVGAGQLEDSVDNTVIPLSRSLQLK